MKTNAINWFEIHVADFERARRFYETALGVKLEVSDMPSGRMGMFPCDYEKGIGGCIVQMEPHRPGRGGTLVYLNVEGELDAVVGRVAAAGGRVTQPRKAIPPHGFIALVEDSEGNPLGLHSMT
jgi:predicted enzyme related to lactoylglutathione lyase